MGKLISLINVTLDGFCDSQYVNANAEFHEFVHSLLDNTHTVAFGRGTFELFQMVWPGVLADPQSPASQIKMARALNDIDKIVFSSTLKQVSWPNTTIMSNMDAQGIMNMKASGDKNLLTIGSPGLIGNLTALGLIDEYYFSVQSLIAGGGKDRMFSQQHLSQRQSLLFVDSKSLGSGVQILHYQKPPVN